MLGNQNLAIHTMIAVLDAVVISTILYGCETWVPYHRNVKLLASFHIRRLQFIPGLRWWHNVTHSEIRSRVGISLTDSMILQRQLHWMDHVIRLPDSKLPLCLLRGQLRLGNRSLSGQRNASWITSSRYIESETFLLAGWRLSHTTEFPGGLPVPLECQTFTMNGIELQFPDAVADISMLQYSAQFRILFINVHFVADNASHALAYSTTA